MLAVDELRQGGGIAHFRERETCRRRTKKCVYPEEDFISTRRCRKPLLDVPRVKSVKIRKRETVPFAGRSRTHRLDLELLFWAALVWSCRCPSSAQHSPFLIASVPQNTFLDTHKSSIPFPNPTEMHIFVLKPCFSTSNCLERIAVLPISYLPFMRRRGRTLM